MKIVAVTQARYGSTRLPAKVLKKVGDETLLDIHLQRILKATKITTLVSRRDLMKLYALHSGMV